MFKRKIDEAFEAVKDPENNLDEEQYRTTIEDEMEKGDFLAMILGAYRFFAPVFIGIIVIMVLLLIFTF